MRVLALDTATAATVAALVDTHSGLGSGVGLAIEARDDPEPGARPRHAAALLGLVEDVLTRGGDLLEMPAPAGIWETIDRIAVGVGPGTFTGLRIGVATAQALARAQNKPLVAISTLQSLALGAAQTVRAGQTLLAVIDARRGEAFAAAYRAPGDPRHGDGTRQPGNERGLAAVPELPPSVLAPAALAEAVSALARDRSQSVLAVGDGALLFRDTLLTAGAMVPEDAGDLHRVSARWHCRLAEAAEPRPLSAIQPEYLRIPDAELKR